MDTRLRDILAHKGGAVHTTSGERTVLDAVREMNARNIGSLVVVEDGRVVGIFTERDVLTRVVEPGRDPRETRVEAVMTLDVEVLGPDTTVNEAMVWMTEKRRRHLPVVREDRLLGLVSIGDLTRHVTRELQFEVYELEAYVTGRYPA